MHIQLRIFLTCDGLIGMLPHRRLRSICAVKAAGTARADDREFVPRRRAEVRGKLPEDAD